MKNEEKKEEDMGTDVAMAKDYSLLQKVECDDDTDAKKKKVEPHNVFTIDNSPRTSECIEDQLKSQEIKDDANETNAKEEKECVSDKSQEIVINNHM